MIVMAAPARSRFVLDASWSWFGVRQSVSQSVNVFVCRCDTKPAGEQFTQLKGKKNEMSTKGSVTSSPTQPTRQSVSQAVTHSVRQADNKSKYWKCFFKPSVLERILSFHELQGI